MGPRIAIAVPLVLLTACLVGEDELDEEPPDVIPTDGLSLYEPSATFNKSGVSHSIDGAGIKVTKTRGDRPVTTYDARHQPLDSVALDEGPSNGTIRIATLESIVVAGKTMYRVWPKGSSNQGWIEIDDVKTAAKVREETSARAGNGQPCGRVGGLEDASGADTRYVVTPKAIIPTGNDATRWKRHSSSDEWFVFHPDWDQPNGVDRVFLMWSWSRTSSSGTNDGFVGGGVVRTEMRAGETFTPCRVQPIRTILRETAVTSGSRPASDSRKLAAYAAYGRYSTPTHNFYGWTIVASRLGDQCQMHIACPGGAGTCPRLPLPASCTY